MSDNETAIGETVMREVGTDGIKKGTIAALTEKTVMVTEDKIDTVVLTMIGIGREGTAMMTGEAVTIEEIDMMIEKIAMMIEKIDMTTEEAVMTEKIVTVTEEIAMMTEEAVMIEGTDMMTEKIAMTTEEIAMTEDTAEMSHGGEKTIDTN